MPLLRYFQRETVVSKRLGLRYAGSGNPAHSEAILKYIFVLICGLVSASPVLADWAAFRTAYESPEPPTDDSIGATLTALDAYFAALRDVDLAAEPKDIRDFQQAALANLRDRRAAIEQYGEFLAMRYAFDGQVKEYQDQYADLTESGYDACDAEDGTAAPDTACKQTVDREAERFQALIAQWVKDTAPSVESKSRSVSAELARTEATQTKLGEAYQRLVAAHP